MKRAEKEIEKYLLKNGDVRYRYRYKYYDTLGKRREKKESSFVTQKDAEKALLKAKIDVANGNLKKVENSQMTVGQWLDIWLNTNAHLWKISTQVVRKRAIENHLKPMLGKYNLNKLDRQTYIRVFIQPLLKKFKPSTVLTYHNYFKIAVNAAVEEEILSRNRFRKVKIEQRAARKNHLTADELNIMIQALKKYTPLTSYTLALLLAYTGMRIGEALALKWRDVDFKKGKISIDFTRDAHGERPPKTKNSYRTIPVDSLLINQMLSYQKWCIETKFRHGFKLDKSADHIFLANTGEPVYTEVMKVALKNAYKKLKSEGVSFTRISPHGLRHTHATILINNGVLPKTIAERLGTTVEMIYKTYGHSLKEMEDKAVTVFSNSVQAAGAKSGAD